MLYLLPDELLVAVAEYCSHPSRKSLSLVFRRLRDPSQRITFKLIRKTLPPSCAADDRQMRQRHFEFISNDRLISYIRALHFYKNMTSYVPEVDHSELLFTALPRMRSLRDIRLDFARVTTTMLDQLCKLLSTRFLNLTLETCSYPVDYIIQQTALKVNQLEWGNEESPRATIKLLAAFIEKSSSTITSLTLLTNVDGLLDFGRLPRLTSFILLREPADGKSLREFLIANPQLVYLELRRPVQDLSLLPSSALPNLTRIRVPAYLIHDIVIGRPVVSVRFHSLFRSRIMLGGVRSLSQSTTPIIELTMGLGHCASPLSMILDAVVEVMPHLERVQLSCHESVRSILYYDAVQPRLTTHFQDAQEVLDHLVRLGSLREIRLLLSSCKLTRKGEVERHFKERFNHPIFLEVSPLLPRTIKCTCD